MGVAEKAEPVPTTLMQAHELLSRMRPTSSSSVAIWLKYYRRSAAIYAEIAEVDRGHHHEALYWANRERVKADALAARVAKNPNAAADLVEEVGGPAAVEHEL